MINPNPKFVFSRGHEWSNLSRKDTLINARINPVIYSAVDQGFPMMLFDIAHPVATIPSTSPDIIEQNPPLS
jgi:hypothetical protein